MGPGVTGILKAAIGQALLRRYTDGSGTLSSVIGLFDAVIILVQSCAGAQDVLLGTVRRVNVNGAAPEVRHIVGVQIVRITGGAVITVTVVDSLGGAVVADIAADTVDVALIIAAALFLIIGYTAISCAGGFICGTVVTQFQTVAALHVLQNRKPMVTVGILGKLGAVVFDRGKFSACVYSQAAKAATFLSL